MCNMCCAVHSVFAHVHSFSYMSGLPTVLKKHVHFQSIVVSIGFGTSPAQKLYPFLKVL